MNYSNEFLYSYAREHFHYEVLMFIVSKKISNQSPPNSFQMNAMVEVCVLHLRNLIDFFYPNKIESDDIVATHYISDWNLQRPPISQILEGARQRANKEMAHLTTKRISGAPPEKNWDFNLISIELKKVIEIFIKNADLSKIDDYTISELQKI
jgi:hypothetical protein